MPLSTPESADLVATELRRLTDATHDMTAELRLRPTKEQVDQAIERSNEATRRANNVTRRFVVISAAIALVVGGLGYRAGSRAATAAEQSTVAARRLEQISGPCAAARGARNLEIIIRRIEDDFAALLAHPPLEHPSLPSLPEGCPG